MAVSLVALLCGSVVVRAKPWGRLRLPGMGHVGLPSVARVDSIELSGAPRALEPRLREAIGFSPGERWGPRRPSRTASRLAEAFPCLKAVDWHRSYLGRTVRFDLDLRTPLAAVSSEGKPAGFLDSTGRVFDAPEGVFERAGLPEVALDGAPAAGGEDLGRFLAAAATPGALPAKLARLRYLAEDQGWTATLDNGMELHWGRLSMTRQKLERLREVLSDAGPRFGGTLTADLRYFEDGKILVRPR